MKNNGLFDSITEMILKYETGDIMLLSDLADTVARLKDEFLETEEAYALVERMIEAVRSEMRSSGQIGFTECLSSCCDLLMRLNSVTDPTGRRLLLDRMHTFLEGGPPDCPSTGENILGQNDDTLQVFLTEATARLEQAQVRILELEKDLKNPEIVQTLFRIFHTIKGECGFLKIASLGELTHNIENLLDGFRSGTVSPEPSHIDVLFEGLDMSRTLLERLRKGDFVLLNTIDMEAYFKKLTDISAKPVPALGKLLVEEGKLSEQEVEKILQKQKESAYTKKFGEIAVKENYLTSEELKKTLQKQTDPDRSVKKLESADPVIKVRTSKVNFLVDMIGELIIAMGQLTESTPVIAQIRKITRSLQFGAMELRTDTVLNLFNNMRRVVRDLSKQLGKQIKLEMTGEELELDRNLIEKLEEPLMHLLRNSMDHGIESEEERIAAGKTPVGTVTLVAERRGNSIVIIIRDDGKGLNRNKILAKAVERGIVKPEAAESMPDTQVYNLVFTSGFSTLDTVSRISGRGVGMDIVRSVVCENRGRIEVETEEGTYTQFSLFFPLSTAIIDGMITRVANNQFVFPIGSVIEAFKVRPDQISTVNGVVEVIDLRGSAVLAIRLASVFNLETSQEKMMIGMVVENSVKQKFIFLVDEVLSKREVVIKSLGSRFNTMRGISSATVLAGGRVGLVLDIDQIIELSLLEEQV